MTSRAMVLPVSVLTKMWEVSGRGRLECCCCVVVEEVVALLECAKSALGAARPLSMSLLLDGWMGGAETATVVVAVVVLEVESLPVVVGCCWLGTTGLVEWLPAVLLVEGRLTG